jgi:hypothetical protein
MLAFTVTTSSSARRYREALMECAAAFSRRLSAPSSHPESEPIIWRTVMRAIVLEKFGGLDSLVYKEIPDPEPKTGHVVIEVKAFGLNQAKMR